MNSILSCGCICRTVSPSDTVLMKLMLVGKARAGTVTFVAASGRLVMQFAFRLACTSSMFSCSASGQTPKLVVHVNSMEKGAGGGVLLLSTWMCQSISAFVCACT